MWERTITVGSAGKAFSSTGAKVFNFKNIKKLVLCTEYKNYLLEEETFSLKS